MNRTNKLLAIVAVSLANVGVAFAGASEINATTNITATVDHSTIVQANAQGSYGTSGLLGGLFGGRASASGGTGATFLNQGVVTENGTSVRGKHKIVATFSNSTMTGGYVNQGLHAH